MSWTDLTFTGSHILTASDMNRLQGNFAALASGAAGAPPIAVNSLIVSGVASIDTLNLTNLPKLFPPHIRVRRGSDLVLGSAWQKCVFDTEDYDPDGDYNSSTGVFTAPEDGIYVIQARTFGSDQHHLSFGTDSNVVFYNVISRWDATDNNNHILASILLSANDKLALWSYNGPGYTLLKGTAESGMSIVWVGDR